MTTIPKQNETALVKACLQYLNMVAGALARRNNTGKLIDRTGRPVTFGLGVGSSDIIGCLPGGRYLAVECKIGKNKLTLNQKLFLESVKAAGGLALCVWSLPELVRAIHDDRKG